MMIPFGSSDTDLETWEDNGLVALLVESGLLVALQPWHMVGMDAGDVGIP
jgi:hypothetical protein